MKTHIFPSVQNASAKGYVIKLCHDASNKIIDPYIST